MALIKFGFDSDVKSHVLTAMQTKEEFLLRAILRAVRKVRWADTEITEKVAYLTARSALTKEANFTLEVIKHNLK